MLCHPSRSLITVFLSNPSGDARNPFCALQGADSSQTCILLSVSGPPQELCPVLLVLFRPRDWCLPVCLLLSVLLHTPAELPGHTGKTQSGLLPEGIALPECGELLILRSGSHGGSGIPSVHHLWLIMGSFLSEHAALACLLPTIKVKADPEILHANVVHISDGGGFCWLFLSCQEPRKQGVQ